MNEPTENNENYCNKIVCNCYKNFNILQVKNKNNKTINLIINMVKK